MKKYHLLFTFLFLLSLSLTKLNAQVSINASGGSIKGKEGSLDYSAGQLVYETANGTSGTITEGVQQPYEIFVVTGIDRVEEKDLTVSAYPNPTHKVLTLEVEDFQPSLFKYHIYNTEGKLIRSEKITDTKSTISMSKLVASTYFVKVARKNKILKTFKIIKK
jgi:hypothetical protein